MIRFRRYAVSTIALAASLTALPARAQQAPIVSDVIIEGQVNVEETLIRSQMTLKKGNVFNPRDVSTTIRELYKLGLFQDVRVYGRSQGSTAVLTVSLKEYPFLDRIEFKGNKKWKAKHLERIAEIYQGQAVSPLRRKQVIERLTKEYNKNGYLLAEVEDRVLIDRNKAVLELTIHEGKKVKLGEIYIEGNYALTDKKLAKALRKKDRTEEKEFWKEGDLRRERLMDQFEKVAKEYRKNGFRDVRVVGDSLWYSENRQRIFLMVKVEEGRRYYLGDVSFEGNTVLKNDQLKELLKVETGKALDEEKYQESVSKIYEAYGEMGYLYATPLARETAANDSVVNVQFAVNEGIPAKVHRIDIIGNTKTKDKVIRREMVMKPGQIFRRSELMRSQREIFQLNFFQDVQPDIAPLPNGDVDVAMTVQEKPTGTANAGAGFSGLDGLVGTISVVVPNFLGNGQTLNFAVDYGQRRKSFSTGFIEPWLFDNPTSAGVDLFWTERRWFQGFNLIEKGFGFSAGRRFRNSYYRVNSNYRFFHQGYREFDEAFTPGKPGAQEDLIRLRQNAEANSGLTSQLGTSFMRDSRDFPQFATRGSRNWVQNNLAGLGGKVKYFKQVLNTEWYLPTGFGTSLSLRGKYGYVINPFNNREVPLYERFFPGGVSFDGSIRGYGNNTIGPYTTIADISGLNSLNDGGRSMAILTLEYTIPIVDQRKSPQPVYGLVFVEAGNAWRSPSSTTFNLKHLKKSAGFGIRVMMPLVGLIGFDFAYGFDRSSDPLLARIQKRSGWNTHFQLGQFF
ncbi:MAG: outer membrane protein assembly factor BamA [candidate division Zixibacteria bacterium]|nr:outer membrane protein assembly factor BamA [candidate division Zixibacteria bacterium]